MRGMFINHVNLMEWRKRGQNCEESLSNYFWPNFTNKQRTAISTWIWSLDLRNDQSFHEFLPTKSLIRKFWYQFNNFVAKFKKTTYWTFFSVELEILHIHKKNSRNTFDVTSLTTPTHMSALSRLYCFSFPSVSSWSISALLSF